MPYRIPDPVSVTARASAHWDDLVLGALIFLLSLPRVILALSMGERFTAEPSLALIGVVIGLVLVGSSLARRR